MAALSALLRLNLAIFRQKIVKNPNLQASRCEILRSGWRDLRRRLKFPNLIVSLTRLGHVLEEYIGPSGSIWHWSRLLAIEIRQIWGWVSAPVFTHKSLHPSLNL